MHWVVVLSVLSTPIRCTIPHVSEDEDLPPAKPSPVTDRKENPPKRIVDPPEQPARSITFPEGVIVRALDKGRSSFVRCFERARNLDPMMGPTKVMLHLEVDVDGFVVSGSTDIAGERPKLSNCLVAIGRSLSFPPPNTPAVVDVPLL